MNKFNYESKQYLKKLNNLGESFYSKYLKYIEESLPNKDSIFLDVGFGSGTVLRKLQADGYINGYGVDISKLFVHEGKKHKLSHLYHYDGTNLPFSNNFFDVIGSFNVLEHTEQPEKFLQEQIRKLKKGGKIIVACPNFISVFFPSASPRLRGPVNKTRNISRIVQRLFFSKHIRLEKMPAIVRKDFQYDDDAIVVTNLIDIEKILKKNGCRTTYKSGFINYDTFLFRAVNSIPFLKYLLPSCFIIAAKDK